MTHSSSSQNDASVPATIPSKPPAAKPNAKPPAVPIWHRTWFQIALGALLILALASLILPTLAWLIYETRSVLLPILIAFAMAYTADPLVDWLQRHRVPRQASAAGLIITVLIVVAALALYVLPLLVKQAASLISKLPTYWHNFLAWAHIDLGALAAKAQAAITGATTASAGGAHGATGATGGGLSHAAAQVDWGAVGRAAMTSLDIGYTVISSTIGLVGYALLAVAILFFCFYFFVWKFDHITSWFVPFIPRRHRDGALTVIHKMDHSVSGFIHGRMVQATCVGIVLCVGWGLVGVPYFLLLGLLGGVLNLIPYAAVASWPLAIILAWLDTLSGGTVSAGGAAAATQAAHTFSVWSVFIGPTVVYLIAQGLDGWVVEPLVQGKATNLDPLTVMVVVLLGGALAGLLGMIIAIPLAACIKIFAREVALPRLRQLAAKE